MEPDQLDPKLERSFRGHRGTVNAVAFNPSMKQVASGGADKIVMVWNFKPELRAFKFQGHKNTITGVQFAPSGKLIAPCSVDHTIRLWQPTVRGVAFSQDERFLLSSSDDKTCKIWSVDNYRFQ